MAISIPQRFLATMLSRVLLTTPLTSTGASIFSSSSRSWSPISLLPASISIPAISISIPGILSDVWDGLLKAVPKKKTSHMKKRHRQLAGKALKDVNAVNTCPGCGKPKKAHTLCPYCVAEIQKSWKQASKTTTKEGIAP